MSIHLRVRSHATAPMPNVMESYELDDQYQFAPLVALIDRALHTDHPIKLRTIEGDALVLRPMSVHSIAIREQR